MCFMSFAQIACLIFILQVSLELERLYGSLDDIRVEYRIASVDRNGQWNFYHVQYASVIMTSQQVTATLTTQVLFHYFIFCIIFLSFSNTFRWVI